MLKEKEYEVTGVLEYAAVVSCTVKASSKKEASEKAIIIFNERAHGEFPEYQGAIVDTPSEIKSI